VHGLYYAPDPSSQIACTIGGNVAENSGGVHCLKYGLTVHNVLAVKMVTIDGELIEPGRRPRWTPRATTCWRCSSAPRACSAVTVEVTVRLLPSRSAPRRCWPPSTTSRGRRRVGDIIAAGIIPAGWR
jgi:glycolate oxidase